jgi:hypothetical protein
MGTRAKMMNELDLAWAAGFLDGEGCLTVQECTKRGAVRPQYQALIDAAQVTPLPLDRLVALFGGQVRPYRKAFYWRLYNAKTVPVCEQLLPYLVGKRRQAELLLEFAALRGRQGVRRSEAVLARQGVLCAAVQALNAGSGRRHAERLSESAPLALVREDGAIVRAATN